MHVYRRPTSPGSGQGSIPHPPASYVLPGPGDWTACDPNPALTIAGFWRYQASSAAHSGRDPVAGWAGLGRGGVPGPRARPGGRWPGNFMIVGSFHGISEPKLATIMVPGPGAPGAGWSPGRAGGGEAGRELQAQGTFGKKDS